MTTDEKLYLVIGALIGLLKGEVSPKEIRIYLENLRDK